MTKSNHSTWSLEFYKCIGGLNLVVLKDFACTCVYVIWNALKNSLQILTKCIYVIWNALKNSLQMLTKCSYMSVPEECRLS